MKRLIFLVMLALLMAGVLLPAAAQEENWVAYLYNPMDKSITRVRDNGVTETFTLGLDENTWVSSYDMAFAHTRVHVAFCAVTYAEGSSTGTSTLIVRDIVGQTNVLQQDLGQSIGCRVGEFSEDDTAVAVGLVRRYEGDPTVDPNVPLWELLLVDPFTGNTVAKLDANNPGNAAAGMVSGMAMMPEVRWFSADQVVFAEIPWGVGGFGPTFAYQWNTTTNEITSVERWGAAAYDTLGGELVWVTYLPEYPSANPGGPMASHNAVKVADKSGEERIVYYSNEWVILSARFIDNGQRIAIQLLSSFNENSPETVQDTKWIALDRAGNQTDLDSAVYYSQLEGVLDGYTYLEMSYVNDDPNQQVFTLDLVRAGAAQRLWEQSATNFGATWELAFVPPITPAEGLTPFPAVDMSGVPVQASEG